jgi:hypothetical protein
VASCRIFLELLTGNSSSRIRKNSPAELTKDGALMMGGMFVVTVMSCSGERFIDVGTRFGLLGTVP